VFYVEATLLDFQGLTPAGNADIFLHCKSAHSASHPVCTEGCIVAHTQQVRHDTNLSPPSRAKD